MANILQFSNLRSALLYAWELEGKISDGKYENSRPYDHWEWVNKTEIRVVPGGTEGTTRWIKKTYNINEWFKYMHDGENHWARRIMSYARFGLMFESVPELWDQLIRRCHYVAENCPDVTYDCENLTRETLNAAFQKEIGRLEKQVEYYTGRNEPRLEKYIQQCKEEVAQLRTIFNAVTDEMIERYNDPEYTENSLKEDHNSMKATVNTPLPF